MFGHGGGGGSRYVGHGGHDKKTGLGVDKGISSKLECGG